jgi:hypothetical protein
MARCFIIQSIALGHHSISVETDKRNMVVSREKFERWLQDDPDRRTNLAWHEYYASGCAEDDIYDYLVIRGGSRMFLDIYNDIKDITRVAL